MRPRRTALHRYPKVPLTKRLKDLPMGGPVLGVGGSVKAKRGVRGSLPPGKGVFGGVSGLFGLSADGNNDFFGLFDLCPIP